MATPGARGSPLEPRFLSQLLLLQGVLHTFRDEERLASFVQFGLEMLPGIESARLVLDGPERPTHPGGAPEPAPDSVSLPLETLGTRFGRIDLRLTCEADVEPYLPHLKNTANVIAIHLEHLARERELGDLNQSLLTEIERKMETERLLNEAQSKLSRLMGVTEPGVQPAPARAPQGGGPVSVGPTLAIAGEAHAAAAGLSGAVTGAAALERVSSVVLQHVERLTESPASRVATLDEQGERLVEGICVEDLSGSLSPRVTGVDQEDFDRLWRRAIESGEPCLVNRSGPSKNRSADSGKSQPVRRFLAVPVRFGGKVVGQIAAANAPRNYTEEDVAGASRLAELYALAIQRERVLEERRQLSLQTEASQRLEALGVMASGIAHEFRNLLQIIQGSAEVVLGKANVRNGPEPEIEEIRLAASRGASLTQQLLAFARRVEPRLAPLELNEAVRRVVAMLERTIPRSIEIELRLAEDAGTVLADSGQIEQVLVNLALNSSDAMPRGGRLTIETRCDANSLQGSGRSTDTAAGPAALLRMSDTGSGIDPAHLDHVFEPFFTTKSSGKGTGLGLSVVYGIVTSHGGAITCSSTRGKGTSFEITLPRIAGPALKEEPQRAEQATSGSGSETILIVDDEAPIRRIIRQGLGRYGYEVIEASSGEEALEVFTKVGDVDAVVLDLGMPGMDGHACLRALRRLNPRIRVLVASGYLVDDQASELAAEGASGVLSKPFRIEVLAEQIRRVLDRSD